MSKYHYLTIIFFIFPYIAKPKDFNRKVPSHQITAECDAQEGDERGPFGIIYKEGKTTHDFLVMTGVYYETCKDLEKRIHLLKKRNSYLVLQGSESAPMKSNNYIWRWKSIQTISGKECISYFVSDCE